MREAGVPCRAPRTVRVAPAVNSAPAESARPARGGNDAMATGVCATAGVARTDAATRRATAIPGTQRASAAVAAISVLPAPTLTRSAPTRHVQHVPLTVSAQAGVATSPQVQTRELAGQGPQTRRAGSVEFVRHAQGRSRPAGPMAPAFARQLVAVPAAVTGRHAKPRTRSPRAGIVERAQIALELERQPAMP